MTLTPRNLDEGCVLDCGTTADLSYLDVISNISFVDPNDGKRVSDDDLHIINLVVNCSICLIICVFGITANIINFSVFVKQGFAESINVSFASLAIADFMALLTLLWRNILYIPQMQDTALPIDPIPFMYLTGGWPHVYFVRVCGWITGFITFERCLCIAMPLKVKSLITPRKVVFLHVALYFLIVSVYLPLYYTNQFVWVFFPAKNRSLITLTVTDDRIEIEKVVFSIQGHVIPNASLFINIVCTAILVAKLNHQSKWRQNQASTGDSKKIENMSLKETRIIKMAITISTISFMCVVPHFVSVSWTTLNPEYNLDGKLKNSFIVIATFAFLLEAFNSSVNIFVYYNMSTKYRLTFFEMFKLKSSNVKT